MVNAGARLSCYDRHLRTSVLRHAAGTLFAMLVALAGASSAPASQWAVVVSSNGIFPGTSRSVHVAGDGTFVVGFARWEASGQDGFVRLAADGSVIRERLYGPSAGDKARGSTMRPTSDGGYVVVTDTLDIHSPPITVRDHTAGVRKLDADGGVLWERHFPAAALFAVTPTDDGSYVAAGWAAAGEATQAWVLMLTADGNVVWQRTYGEHTSLGALIPVAGGYVAAGSIAASDSSPTDAWVLLLDRSGEILWQFAVGGPKTDVATALAQGPDGYLVAGYTRSFGAGDGDGWLVKVDDSGAIEWQKTYGGAGFDDFTDAIALGAPRGGGYLVAGSTMSFGVKETDGWLVRVNAQGDVVWQRTYGGVGYDTLHAVRPTPDGGLVAVGFTSSFLAGRAADAWVLKLAGDGTFADCMNVLPASARVAESAAVSSPTRAVAVPGRVSAGFVVPVASDVAHATASACYATWPAPLVAVEYYHAGFDHYFVTASEAEQHSLAGGSAAGWVRTGHSFTAYVPGPPVAGVCRYWSGSTYAPRSTHFYSSLEPECARLAADPAWLFEGTSFAVKPPLLDLVCEADHLPVYRLYNDGRGGAPNHRYTTSTSVRNEMIAQGWQPEGVGEGVVGCVPTQ